MPFSAERAERVVSFFEKVLVQTSGEWAGKPFTLQPWQRDEILRPLFGTLTDDGFRQYRTAFVELPRKNGKSTLCAGLALYLLLADGEPGAEIYGAAGDRDQASLVFQTAAEMVRRSPLLSKRLRVLDATKRIIHQDSGSVYRAIPADAAGSHGFNAHAVIVDELHVQPNRELWDVLTTSTGARRQPLTVAITTAGYDRHSICWELHDYATKVARGVIEDRRFFPYIKAADEADDWREPAIWAKANPGLGVTVKADYLEAEAQRAAQTPAYENTFRRLHLNQWTQQETRWLPLDAWDAAAGSVDIASLRGRPCYAGLDLASTTDIAALVLVFPHEDGTYSVLPHFWIPSESMVERARRDRVPYDVWVRQGYIEATPGNVIDYSAIRKRVEQLRITYDIREIGFDSWGATQLVQELSDAGATVVRIGQGFAQMTAPTKELLSQVIAGRLQHGGNPVLRWMADNLVVRSDPAGNIRPDKARSREKIDGMVALIMALDRVTRRQPEPAPSVYEGRGLLVL